MRLDQWIWAVRLYRTRALAAGEVRGGHVRVGGQIVKPAREIRAGDIVSALTGTITRIYRVIGFPESRVAAPRVPEYAEDLTPAITPPSARTDPGPPGFRRPRGAGRPTKKERRLLEPFFAPRG